MIFLKIKTKNEVNTMSNQNPAFNLEATKLRPLFAEYLEKMANIIDQSEEQATQKGASGSLALSSSLENLNQEAERLKNGKFRFLIIGDFNRGKSSILNAFFEKEMLQIGATATTSIPTFIKYGEREEVIVHKKDGTKERLEIEAYKQKYSLNKVRQIKRIDKYLKQWLKPLDYAEVYSPIEILSRGVEFIDTAGLNHTEEENEKTFSYIEQAHAIIFVLAADYQFTDQEKSYLEKFLGIKQEIEAQQAQETQENLDKKQTKPIFYLINKWDRYQEKEQIHEIHDVFVYNFSECLKVTENEAEKMWGDTIFDVSAENALHRLSQGQSLEGTGLKKFQERLDDFLINERLMTELSQAVYLAESVAIGVASQVNLRLEILENDVKDLEEKIERTKPNIKEMKKIYQTFKENISNKKKSCIDQVEGKYHTYFSQLVNNFEREFNMPTPSGLRDNQREEYTKILENTLVEYRKEKLNQWHDISQGIVSESINDLNIKVEQIVKEYDKEREKVRLILTPENENFNAKNPRASSNYENISSEEASFRSADANAIGKMIQGMAVGTTGTATLGAGAVAIAHTLGLATNIGLVTVGSAIALTPVGWALLGGSAIVGGVTAWLRRGGEVQKFQEQMQAQAKEDFKKLLDSDKVTQLKGEVGHLFDPFEELANQLEKDVTSLEQSLDNLLEKKKTTEVNNQAETKRLKAFKEDISKQLRVVEAKYKEIETATSKT